MVSKVVVVVEITSKLHCFEGEYCSHLNCSSILNSSVDGCRVNSLKPEFKSFPSNALTVSWLFRNSISSSSPELRNFALNIALFIARLRSVALGRLETNSKTHLSIPF